ncbi:hypothetical protein XM38_007660 [Halomicronema hongdechloris C2206]|uniref:Uncharacterized protein n=1 Tax=Halomicronema hongdechloris C2206 TaxID=1641165 RepID=A0A1Z3HHR9_9CYAN|nr:hypothetical protein [Halomicronema hongdechloris]ASC69836.1 hypothetical protein XM38_007660 [Halomicronema hongdechloris C2206]
MSMLSAPSRCEPPYALLEQSRRPPEASFPHAIAPTNWIADQTSPYSLAHQVELQHLQAEADALLRQLQAIQQARGTSPTSTLQQK